MFLFLCQNLWFFIKNNVNLSSLSFQENSSLVVPWILGFITFMALEAVAMVYSNVLRDHVNRVSITRIFYARIKLPSGLQCLLFCVHLY